MQPMLGAGAERRLIGVNANANPARLEPAGVPCGPVNTVDQVFAEPQAIHRGLTVEQSRDDLATPIRTVASPIRLSKTPVRYDAPPPRLTTGLLGDTEACRRTLHDLHRLWQRNPEIALTPSHCGEVAHESGGHGLA